MHITIHYWCYCPSSAVPVLSKFFSTLALPQFAEAPGQRADKGACCGGVDVSYQILNRIPGDDFFHEISMD